MLELKSAKKRQEEIFEMIASFIERAEEIHVILYLAFFSKPEV